MSCVCMCGYVLVVFVSVRVYACVWEMGESVHMHICCTRSLCTYIPVYALMLVAMVCGKEALLCLHDYIEAAISDSKWWTKYIQITIVVQIVN